ncbi:MAG: decarboxylating 6-phosphogluconate dehydrogenase [Patescibacteria group bacterium]|nr:decarboxylating 6-phosphogluconate dehydrogenase [Patescibacteria group bacterium]
MTKPSSKPPLTIFGLGRMGAQIARRLHKSGFTVIAWNRSSGPVEEVRKAGVYSTSDIEEAVSRATVAAEEAGTPRIFWVMLPQAIVDQFILGKDHIGPHLKKGDIVIDGGNSFYKDSMRRGAELEKRGIRFFDCGTSGGIWGEQNGFALMIGGAKDMWPIVEPIFATLSSGDNFAFLGKAGAGHFTKMVHNGIEYGMMEAIGEGYAVLEAGPFDLNLSDVTRVYQTGSVVRSWLIDLCRDIFDQEDIAAISGKIDATGEGEWTVKAAEELGIDARVIRDSLEVRKESADPENQNKFSNKIVALLRKHFGGHAVH